MLVLAIKPGHDGSVAAVEDGNLLYSIEGEKDSFQRRSPFQPERVLTAIERLGTVPDVVAISGWAKPGRIGLAHTWIGGGYVGAHVVTHRKTKILGTPTIEFADSHERSHIFGAIGMGPRTDSPLLAVLVWEGMIGSFYLVDRSWQVVRQIRVFRGPGTRYAFVYALADPGFDGFLPEPESPGKVMALAGFGNAMQAAPQIEDSVEAILHKKTVKSDPEWRASPLYNIGVEAQETKDAAALLTDRIFNRFAEVAVQEIPEGLPLYIGGGCGLNCDWNARWRDLGHFSSVFVPPCPNDAGSAIGTALDALATLRGDPHLAWSVYSGLEFEWDVESWPAEWTRKPLDYPAIAEALDDGRIFAWVQGRWEIGPRALGNRSILAEPFNPATKVRLNEIKQREDYRPIAPCCRVEDLGEAFVDDHEDPYMLYFNRARLPSLRAVMHVDGSARVQTVSRSSNEKLHRLLTAFAERRRVGVLCNTSLNFKGHGFVNRMSDLIRYCATRGIDDVVVGDEWFLSNRPS